jgi:hypothetical protein
MDEHAQQRTRQALFDAMELLDNKPEKFAGIILLFSEAINQESAAHTTFIAGLPSFVKKAKATLDTEFEHIGGLND